MFSIDFKNEKIHLFDELKNYSMPLANELVLSIAMSMSAQEFLPVLKRQLKQFEQEFEIIQSDYDKLVSEYEALAEEKRILEPVAERHARLAHVPASELIVPVDTHAPVRHQEINEEMRELDRQMGEAFKRLKEAERIRELGSLRLKELGKIIQKPNEYSWFLSWLKENISHNNNVE